VPLVCNKTKHRLAKTLQGCSLIDLNLKIPLVNAYLHEGFRSLSLAEVGVAEGESKGKQKNKHKK
jgi:hypothetical protein